MQQDNKPGAAHWCSRLVSTTVFIVFTATSPIFKCTFTFCQHSILNSWQKPNVNFCTYFQQQYCYYNKAELWLQYTEIPTEYSDYAYSLINICNVYITLFTLCIEFPVSRLSVFIYFKFSFNSRISVVLTNTITYVDDKGVVTNSQKEWYGNKVTRVWYEDVKKIKVMCIRENGNNKLKIYFDGQQMSQFRNLGNLISKDGYCTRDSEQKWDGKESIYREKKCLPENEPGTKEEIKRIMKCLVWSVALHAAETWTSTLTDRRRLEASEMWIWRRMEKISWLTNNKVLRRENKDKQVLNSI